MPHVGNPGMVSQNVKTMILNAGKNQSAIPMTAKMMITTVGLSIMVTILVKMQNV